MIEERIMSPEEQKKIAERAFTNYKMDNQEISLKDFKMYFSKHKHLLLWSLINSKNIL